uniref:Uncharacterized protein n=1 Tax=Candidatus Kentrum sp. TC TaxID=2126339 RepID=A0A450Y828_9GAMM|nr:MAG: hypothetical protein BECKTC1821E_GA0114239_100164 [Candidatus Kentron sp. TC]
MVMNEKALIERDAERDVRQETLNAIRDIKSGKVGHVETVELLPVVEARQNTGLFSVWILGTPRRVGSYPADAVRAKR